MPCRVKRYRFHPQALSNTLKIYINKVVSIRPNLFSGVSSCSEYIGNIYISSTSSSGTFFTASVNGRRNGSIVICPTRIRTCHFKFLVNFAYENFTRTYLTESFHCHPDRITPNAILTELNEWKNLWQRLMHGDASTAPDMTIRSRSLPHTADQPHEKNFVSVTDCFYHQRLFFLFDEGPK